MRTKNIELENKQWVVSVIWTGKKIIGPSKEFKTSREFSITLINLEHHASINSQNPNDIKM